MQRRHLLASLGASSVPATVISASADTMRVIASFSILADLALQVGAPYVKVGALVGPDEDVHIYNPKPADLRAVMGAKVLAINGLGLEGWMERLTSAARFSGVLVIAAANVVPRTMHVPDGNNSGGSEGRGNGAGGTDTSASDRARKDRQGTIAVDPHAWQDPRNAVLYAHAIAEGLAAVDPLHAQAYRDGAVQYAARITQTDNWIVERLRSVPWDRRRIITTHDAFGYYGARYGVEFLSPEGISTEVEPSAKTIAALVAQIRRQNVQAVFIENMTSPRIAQMLARETGAILGGTVYSDALSHTEGPAATYLDMLRHNTTLFADAMHPPR